MLIASLKNFIFEAIIDVRQLLMWGYLSWKPGTYIIFILIQTGKFDSISNGEDASVIFFNQWTEQVKKNVPEDKLLVFDCKEGWDPLCNFLDVPVPNQPFPWENDTASIQNFFRRLTILSYVTVFGIPILFGLCMVGWRNLMF